MATNPYVNKVIYGGTTVMDISDSDVQESDVANGKVFYKGNGARSVGTGVSGDYVTEPELRDTVGWTGKNLLKISTSVATQTINGVTFTVNRNSDGEVTSVVANGTASAEAAFEFFNNFSAIKNGTYILNGCPANGSASTYKMMVIKSPSPSLSDIGQGVEVLVGDYTLYNIRIVIASGQVCDNLTFYPMLRYADISDATFEPYHKSVKQTLRDGEVIDGKNLLPITAYTDTINGVTFTVNTDGTITADGTSTAVTEFIFFEDLTNSCPFNGYILSGCPSGGSGSTYDLRLSDVTTGSSPDTGTGTTISLADTGKWRAMVYVRNGQTLSNVVFKPMIRETSESTDFEPYYIPLKDSKFERSEQRILGAKNLLPYPYYRESGWVNRGITFTYSEEGKLIANGTSSESNLDSFCTVYYNKTLESGTYTVSGCPSGGSSSTYWIHVFINGADTGRDYGNGYTFTYTKGDTLDIQVRIARNGYVANNVTFKPMIRLASDPDDTYVPYAMTNKELTEKVKNIPYEIVRTGVTESSGGTVRIPASGTDSRISTANTCVVTPIADTKTDGSLYKFSSCVVSNGYATITLAEAISNVTIGVQVVNY